MKRLTLSFLFTICFCYSSFSQINFEPGYFINNSGDRTECLIRNVDWQYNPSKFDYKLTENSTAQTGNLESVKEFGVSDEFKYVRATVDIDLSSNSVNHLSDTKEPNFEKQTLFLKVLVEGNATLFGYQKNTLARYFFQIGNDDIKQLIYKRYLTSSYSENENKYIRKQFENKRGLAENNWYRQQIWSNLKCEEITKSRIEKLDYQKTELSRLFMDFNTCGEQDSKKYERKERDLFNLTLRPGINNSSLSIANDLTVSRNNIDFGSKIGFRLGLEGEFILPFNKNKWAIIAEPTYQSFTSEKTIETDNVSGGIIQTDISYSSIELPVGLRHYIFLSDKSKIFINASRLFDFALDSSVEFQRADGSEFDIPLDIERKEHWTFGVGFKTMDRFSLELRYEGNRKILYQYAFWDSDYETISLIFGFSIL